MIKGQNKIKLGDLVNFKSGVDMWMDVYAKRNPGVVINISKRNPGLGSKMSAEVLWSDGSVTSEHSGYLNLHEDR